MVEHGINASQLAKKVGLSHVAIGNYLAGNLPKSEHLIKLAEEFGKTTDFLLCREDEAPSEIKKSYKTSNVPKNHGGPYWGTSCTAPIISWASAGTGNDFQDMGDDPESVERIATDCKDANCYGLKVKGDSMSPAYRDGDVIVVMPNSEAQNGDLVVARIKKDHDEDVLFKKLRWSDDGKRARLIPLNPEYEILEVERRKIVFLHPIFSITRFRSNFFK